jgi:hypothetical protein
VVLLAVAGPARAATGGGGPTQLAGVSGADRLVPRLDAKPPTTYPLRLKEPMPREDPGFEPGMALGQMAGGSGAAVLSLLLLAVGQGPMAVPVLVGAPALVGLTVCQVGTVSSYYESSCGAVIGGAFAGALSVIPLAFLGMSLDHGENGDGYTGFGGAMVGALVGWVVVQPLAATAFWHLFKTPKRLRPSLALPRAPSAAPRPRAADRLPGQVSASVVSLAF